MRNFGKLLVILIFFIPHFIFCQKINLVRDAEIENFLNEISNPIISLIETDSKNIRFYLDKQPYINAFVTNGPRIFVTTELLTKTKNVNQIVGVIAHEFGHIVGGHLNKRNRAYNNSLITSVLSSILAVGAIAAGAPDAGTAIMLGGQHIGQKQFLSFSRNQESFADQTAIKLLQKSGYSTNGMYELFEILEKKERISRFNPYNMTHPLSSERKKILEFHVDKNDSKNPYLEKKLILLQAKLNGFLSSDEYISSIYDEDSVEYWYSNSIRSHLVGDKNKAIKFIDKCIKSDSKNPYFYEIKAQILYEHGEALNSSYNYRKALSLIENERHFLFGLAKALYSTGDKKNYLESIDLLKKYIGVEEFPVDAWHFLALCYGKMEQYSLSSLALSEKFLLLNDIKNAKLQLNRALQFNSKNNDKNISSQITDLKIIIKQKEKNE